MMTFKSCFFSLSCCQMQDLNPSCQDYESSFYCCATRGQCYKTFYGRKSRIVVISQSACPCQDLSMLVLCFSGKSGACPSEKPFRGSTLGQAPGLVHKHQSRLEMLAKANTPAYYENSQLSAVKSFITLVTGNC